MCIKNTTYQENIFWFHMSYKGLFFHLFFILLVFLTEFLLPEAILYQLIVEAIFLMYPWIFLVSTWIAALKLTSLQSLFYRVLNSFRELNLGYNPSCIMRGFLISEDLLIFCSGCFTWRSLDNWKAYVVKASHVLLI